MNETLFEKLQEYGRSEIYPFHMPGHKRRLGPSEAGSLYQMDITEIDGFDNLHDAEGILKEAQEYAAEMFQSEETHFMVNGSTGGILAAIAGTCDDGGIILAARNCHKAVYHAIELHHLKPVYLYPAINRIYGINEGIYPQDIEKMWINHPKIQAIVITSPTYDGVVSDVREICRIAHAHHVPVIVDEAHGAHLHFSDYFPESAVTCGADIVIQSTHKTLPAMTQTALIHLNGDLIDRERVRRMLAVYQSSSPSYILMGSIDACMHMLKKDGDYLYKNYVSALKELRSAIHTCSHIKMPELCDFNKEYTKNYDRSKLVLSVRNTNMSGSRLHEILLEHYGLQMEMASADYVLAMTSVGDSSDGYERLASALREIDQTMDAHQKQILNTQLKQSYENEMKWPDKLPAAAAKMSIYEAQRQKRTMCSLSESIGAVAADYLYVYPPGIPLVTPGEYITEEIAATAERWLQSGLHVSGICQNSRNENTAYQNNIDGNGQPMIRIINEG